jgi:hypothetical protein
VVSVKSSNGGWQLNECAAKPKNDPGVLMSSETVAGSAQGESCPTRPTSSSSSRLTEHLRVLA